MNKTNQNIVFSLFLVALASMISACTNPVSGSDKAADLNAKLGAQYLQKGHYKLADEKLRKALSQSPDSIDANHYFALLQQQLGKTDSASKHFSKASRLAPDSPEINNNYGTFLCKQKQFSKADVLFNKAISDPLYSTPAYALANAGTCAQESNQINKADAYFRSALLKIPNFHKALLGLAEIAHGRGDYPRAQAFLLRYNEVAGNNAKTLGLCHSIHIKLGETETANKCSSALLLKFPQSKEALSLK